MIIYYEVFRLDFFALDIAACLQRENNYNITKDNTSFKNLAVSTIIEK